MGTKTELAQENFRAGMNCAQAVLSAFCEGYGVDPETALRMTGGFGAGLRMGEVCGAASGAALVVGLKFGQRTAEDSAAKAECQARTAEFMRAFQAENSSVLCREILGYDPSVPEEYARAQGTGLFKTVCLDTVRSAALLLEELGY